MISDEQAAQASVCQSCWAVVIDHMKHQLFHLEEHAVYAEFMPCDAYLAYAVCGDCGVMSPDVTRHAIFVAFFGGCAHHSEDQ